MAGNQGMMTTPADQGSTTAGSPRTIIQLITTTVRAKILAWGVYFNGTNATGEPVTVRLLRQTAVLGGTPTAADTKLVDKSIADALVTTGQVPGASPSEPASGDVLKTIKVHPQNGYEWTAPFGGEVIVQLNARLGIEVTVPTGGAALSMRAFFHFEE